MTLGQSCFRDKAAAPGHMDIKLGPPHSQLMPVLGLTHHSKRTKVGLLPPLQEIPGQLQTPPSQLSESKHGPK